MLVAPVIALIRCVVRNKKRAKGPSVLGVGNLMEGWLLRFGGEEEEKKGGDQSPFRPVVFTWSNLDNH